MTGEPSSASESSGASAPTTAKPTSEAAKRMQAVGRKVRATPLGDPAFVRVRVWGQPGWLSAAHGAALGALACSPDLGIADLRISVVTMREPDSNWREPRIVVALTAAVFETPAGGTLEDECGRCIVATTERILDALRAHDPAPQIGPCRGDSVLWSVMPDGVLVTPIATPYR
jgi:hypothetical protein